MRTLVVLGFGLISLGGCLNSDAPTIALHIYDGGIVPGSPPPGPNLAIELRRPSGHTFAATRATINGVDAGEPTLFAGHDVVYFKEPARDASASFEVPLASIERGAHVEIDEGSEHFVMDVPDLNAPRAINVHTSLDGLRADGWVEIDTGVATDVLDAGFTVTDATADGGLCFTQWGRAFSATGMALQLPPAGTFEDCGPPQTTNAPGSTRAVEMRFSTRVETPIARCDGPSLTCDPVAAADVTRTMPATLQY